MKKIIKRIVSCVLFVAILLGLLQVSSLIFQPKSNDKAAGIHYPRANGIFSEPKDSIDTVFIGDSEVYHSFIPLNIWRDYGITSYDVSSPAQKLVYSMEFLKKTFEKQTPKIVFLETNAIFRKSYLRMKSHIRQSRFSLCSDIMTVGRIFSSRIFRLQLNILRMRITKVITLLKSLSLRQIRLSRNI